MITYKIHLLRTGATWDGETFRYVGQQNPPLCPQGVEELARLGREFRYPRAEMVFTSPLARCVETAQILYPDLYREEMEGLADLNLGRFEGHSLEELREDPAFAAWLENSHASPPPGGENPEDFQRRIVGAVQQIFYRMMERKMGSVAVVTHGGVILSLLSGICLPKRPMQDWLTPNGTGYTLLFTPQMWMRDGCAEVFARQPQPPEEPEGDRGEGWY